MAEQSRTAWRRWLEELHYLSRVRVSRCYQPKRTARPPIAQLHHFCDASQQAYGAVSYLRTTTEDGVHHVSFVCGKAKLAPSKRLTIPRLELCAAVMAAKLEGQLKEALDLQISRSVFWTDSTAVLQYIRNTERRFQTFVANRVVAIHESSRAEQWHHVTSVMNPADDASRGLSGPDLDKDSRWIQGPFFLTLDEDKWPKNPQAIPELADGDPEVKKGGTTLVARVNQGEGFLQKLWDRCSSWYQLRKNVAWLMRFIKWIKWRYTTTTDDDIPIGGLRVSELDEAKLNIIRLVQEVSFRHEINALRQGDSLHGSSLSRLEPFIGTDGLLRVGGRLRHANLCPEQKYPILLPRDCKVTELIVREVHSTKTGHSGREYTLATLRTTYWIPKCRRLIDKLLRTCVNCRRNNWISTHQRQADLPEDRVHSGGRPFTHSGVDCFGPFLVKQGRARPKRWGCLFTCLNTRAIHLEVLASLDADAFINAMTRFSSRRGPPSRIRSDNGTNMIGANRELRDAVQEWNSSNTVRNVFLQKHIEWEFNPPAASHMGGVWERQIRTVRKVLQVVIGSQVLDDERLHTLFCAVEEIVNGRPITTVSNDPRDLEALTPLHLLRMGPDTLSTGGDHTMTETYRRRWKHAQFIADQFWKRWTREYLPMLRQRQKHLKTHRNLREGDIVVVSGHPIPRSHWMLGRIVEAMPGDDGIVRRAKVKTKNSVITRPVTKLCLLEGVAE